MLGSSVHLCRLDFSPLPATRATRASLCTDRIPLPCPRRLYKPTGGPRFLLPHLASPSSRRDPALAIAAALLELSRALASCSARTNPALDAHSLAPLPPGH